MLARDGPDPWVAQGSDSSYHFKLVTRNLMPGRLSIRQSRYHFQSMPSGSVVIAASTHHCVSAAVI